MPLTHDLLLTITAMTLAHLLADFVFQTTYMVKNKEKPHVFAMHIIVVGVTTWIALGGGLALAAAVASLHLITDVIKTHLLPKNLTTFVGDQLAHVLAIIGLALLAPETVANGIWAPYTQTLAPIAIMVSGLILTTRTGGFLIAALMEPYRGQGPSEGLPGAGQMIGLLERIMIFAMIFIGEPTGIGFLIAAKSILRFDIATKSQKAGEYVIIGTLASFAWAFGIAYITLYWLGLAQP